MNLFSFKIGGPAGFGIMSAGLAFSKIATRSGYQVFGYTEYPSLIRGGHNIMQVVVSDDWVGSPVKHTDFLVALNQETVELHKDEMVEGGGILYDSERRIDTSHLPEHLGLFPIPLVKIARDLGGIEIMRNTVALGATMALLGGELQHVLDLIAEEFGDKKPEIVELNQKVARAGYDYAKEHFSGKEKNVLNSKSDPSAKLVLTGNEAIALGAIAAGMKFTAIYPMTPTSNILHSLAPVQQKYGFIYKQPEDEIAAINMAIGASFAGARAMVATSGGGFCLMTEGFGLAGVTETPLVIILGQRPGPATGLPTWTEQGDLRFALHAHQGDFPRIILAPGDAEEVFHMTMQAFNLADKYQTPVVVIVDKMICESHWTLAPFDYSLYQVNRGKLQLEAKESYERYVWSDDGVSPRALPGQGLHFVANSDEHNPTGYSDEEAEVRRQQMDKRMMKLITCANEDMVRTPVIHGPLDAPVTVVSWGSNKGAILQAMKHFQNQGQTMPFNYLHLTWINPFPAEYVREILSKAKYLINIENNYSAQMAGWIRQQTGIEIKDNLLKYDGRPIYPEEIVEKINLVEKGR